MWQITKFPFTAKNTSKHFLYLKIIAKVRMEEDDKA